MITGLRRNRTSAETLAKIFVIWHKTLGRTHQSAFQKTISSFTAGEIKADTLDWEGSRDGWRIGSKFSDDTKLFVDKDVYDPEVLYFGVRPGNYRDTELTRREAEGVKNFYEELSKYLHEKGVGIDLPHITGHG